MMALTPMEVKHIRELRGKDSGVNVAKFFHVTPETIRRIWRGENHIPPRESMSAVAGIVEGLRALAAGEPGQEIQREAGAPATVSGSLQAVIDRLTGEGGAEPALPKVDVKGLSPEMAEMMKKMGGV
jgi:hypothetical protein